MTTSPYIQRAAALALVWSELLDDMAPAEECSGPADLLARRDQLRRELRQHLERSDLGAGADKWVQRAFWAAPPKRHGLDEKWKEPLSGWIGAMGLTSDATTDVQLALRSLFADGAAAAAELAARRPGLHAAVVRGLGAATPNEDEICRLAATHLLEDSYLPMYLTDAGLTRVAWSNRSLQALLGLAADEILRSGFGELVARLGEMMSPEHRSAFVQRQEEVLVAGRTIGRGYIASVIDTARRHWTHGLPTPPWEGRYHLEAHAHFVLDRRGTARIGSMVVLMPRRLDAKPEAVS